MYGWAPSSATTCAGGAPTGQQLTWDAEGRLAAWQNTRSGPTLTAQYLYDGEGNRVVQQVTDSTAGTTTTTSYIGSLETVTSNGTTTTTTDYASAGSVLAESVNGTLSYLATNYQGSVVAALNGSGGVTASQLYAPYGGVRYASGALPTDYGYTGQRADTSTGLDYYGARYYDPLLGQFTSTDTLLAGGLNRYGYVGGNPTTATDPSGHRDDENSDEGSVSGVQGAPPGAYAAGAGGGGGLAAFFAWLLGEDEATSQAAATSGATVGADDFRLQVQEYGKSDTYLTYDGDATVTETIETSDGQIIKTTTWGAKDWPGAATDDPMLSDAGTRYYKNLAQEYGSDTPTSDGGGGSGGNGRSGGSRGNGGGTGGGGGSNTSGNPPVNPGGITDAEVSDGVESAVDSLSSSFDTDNWAFRGVENQFSPNMNDDPNIGAYVDRYYFRFRTPEGIARISGNFDPEAREWQWEGWHPSSTQENDYWREIADRWRI